MARRGATPIAIYFVVFFPRGSIVTIRHRSAQDLIKQLRASSGAPISDCKKAVDASDGDLDAAFEWLRKKGAARATEKAGRSASQGRLLLLLRRSPSRVVVSFNNRPPRWSESEARARSDRTDSIRVESNRIESNRIESNRIESNRIELN